MSRLIIRIMFDVKTENHNYNYNCSFVAGCLPESAGLIWLRPAVRGSMLAMMSKTSGFYNNHYHDDNEHEREHYNNVAMMSGF